MGPKFLHSASAMLKVSQNVTNIMQASREGDPRNYDGERFELHYTDEAIPRQKVTADSAFGQSTSSITNVP